MGMEDNGAFLMCSESGCGRRWSVQIEGPKCSAHQWDKPTATPTSAAVFAYRQVYEGPKAWAHRIIERSKHESGVTETVLAMARRALGEIE
jgi:hypothetical protein